MVAAPDYLTMAKAARHAPTQPAPATIWRWCRKGVKSRGGMRVRLKHVRVGGRVYTTREWLERFFEEVAEADVVAHQLPETVTAEAELGVVDHHTAVRELMEAGL